MDLKKHEQIKKQAKQIMEKFALTLQKVKFVEKHVEKRVGGFREEGDGFSADPDFRERFFKNAPKKEGDFIVAEKKKW